MPQTTPSTNNARRWRQRAQRRRQRGAAAFIVTLVMTLLTAMGIFAAKAAGMTELAAGYERQNEQTHYLLQHGMALALQQVARNSNQYGKFDPNSGTVMKQAPSDCPSSVKYPLSGYVCAKFDTDLLSQAITTAQQQGGKPVVPYLSLPQLPALSANPSQNVPGSLGHAALYPRMFLEFGDVGPVGRPLSGTAVAGQGAQFRYYQGSLMSWAQIGPYPNISAGGPTAACTAEEQGMAVVAARESGRGFVVFGPVNSN